jgi:ubiquinol-cytochrome c reductase cytochrome b subunit
MMRLLLDWLDDRTGFRRMLHEALYENIPSGARFRYITGSMLVFAFAVQAITGVFLWMAYSPSSQTAYESVYYIQHEMTGGWLVRGIHHFTSQAMVVVMALHLLQVVWDGAYRAPREMNYWIGLALLMIVLGLGLTGYLLPWDQKGYWATNVATNLMTLVPYVGDELQQLAIGGNEYGHHTLTRFFAMHAGVLPALLVLFLGMHLALFRRHGITARITAGRPDDTFWPRQVLYDGIGCLVLLGVVLLCVIHFDLVGLVQGKLPLEHRGAELGAPADPAEQYSAARPEWYYLFLFQLLKYFPGPQEYIGALVIPGAVMTLLFLVPFIGRFQLGHWFNRAFVVLLLVAAGGLTLLALREDYFVQLPSWAQFPIFEHDQKSQEKLATSSKEFITARRDAERNGQRIVELVNRRTVREDGTLSPPWRIQRTGAVHLLRSDPLIHGPKLFDQHCASCHAYRDPSSREDVTPQANQGDAPPSKSAPNLFAFASRAWIKGLLSKEGVISADYFGNTAHRDGRMAKWVEAHADLLKDDPAKPDDDVDAIAAALSAQAQLRSQAEADARDAALVERGVALLQKNCTNECHRFGDFGQLGLAPDLTGYGSYEWMMGLVSDPTHDRYYRRENDRMPSFAKDLDQPQRHSLRVRELSLIVDWLRGEYYVAGDKSPAPPHSEPEALLAVRRARTVAEPARALVGGPKPTRRQRAEALFVRNCSACHSHVDENGRGIHARNLTAPNLYGFASRTWLAGLLDPDRIAGERYFGKTAHFEGDMVTFVRDNLRELDDAKREKLAAIVAALSAEAALPAQAEADRQDRESGTLDKGRAAIAESWDTASCVDCHKFHDQGDLGAAPDLTAYGSKDWLVRMISDPAHESLYRDTNDRMPSFGVDPPGAKQSILAPEDIDLLARWLRGEDVDAP